MRVKPVSINLSRSTLSYHFLADQLLALITKHNIDISLLELEVTETAEVDNQLVFSQALEKLKNMVSLFPLMTSAFATPVFRCSLLSISIF